MRVNRARPRSSSSLSKKRFNAIPRSFSRSIAKKNFTRGVLRNFFGGGIQSSTNPLTRKDVRSVLDEAGVLGMLDPTAQGPRSKEAYRLTEKEAIAILKKTREAMQENLKKQGYGIKEQGRYYGADPKRIYRRAIEEEFNVEHGPSSAEAIQAEQEQRVLAARRRQVQREALGLKSMSVGKLTDTHEPRKEARRAGLEERLEASRAKNAPADASQQAAQKAKASGTSTTKPAASTTPTSGFRALPFHPPASGGRAVHSNALHLPPRFNPDAPVDDLPFPPTNRPPQQDEQPAKPPVEPPSATLPHDEPPDEGTPASTIDENLPL